MMKRLRYDQLRPAVLLNQGVVLVDHVVDPGVVKEGFRLGQRERAKQEDGQQEKQTFLVMVRTSLFIRFCGTPPGERERCPVSPAESSITYIW